MHSPLVDTTEMYLRTVFELEEEGVVPLRARLVERLHQSGPTVSETCARLEREGLLVLSPDRSLVLTGRGRVLATSVMRKHRLAERLLVDVIGLRPDLVHAEACRWEHVISDEVEDRLVELLGDPAESPFGLPVPGRGAADDEPVVLVPLVEAAQVGGSEVVVRWIGEAAQADPQVWTALEEAGVRHGAHLHVAGAQADGGVLVRRDAGEPVAVPAPAAAQVRVLVADEPT